MRPVNSVLGSIGTTIFTVMSALAAKTGAINPGQGFPFMVDRVVPLAQSKDGKNTFEIRGKLDGNAPWLRPGMEGVAKLDTGRHSLLWIGTRRIRDQLRLWLWW